VAFVLAPEMLVLSARAHGAHDRTVRHNNGAWEATGADCTARRISKLSRWAIETESVADTGIFAGSAIQAMCHTGCLVVLAGITIGAKWIRI